MSESVIDIIVFSPKKFFPEGSYWHVECSFHNCVENISPDDQKILAQCPKEIKNFTFSKKRIFPKLIMCIRNLHFWNSHEKLFDKRLKYFSLNVGTRWENIYLKNNSPNVSLVTQIAFLTSLPLFWQNAEISSQSVRNWKKIQIKLFLEKFHRERWMQFWQTRTKISDKSHNFCAQCPTLTKK